MSDLVSIAAINVAGIIGLGAMQGWLKWKSDRYAERLAAATRAEAKADAAAVAEETKKALEVASEAQRLTLALANKEVASVLQHNTAAQAEASAAQADQLSAIAKVGKDTHTLVNNAMAVQLELNAAALAELAAAVPSLAHQEAADLARKKLADHRAKQQIVDASEGDPVTPIDGGAKV